MENTLRNEVTVHLGGVDRVMRATFTAIMAIEKALGKSMTAIISELANGDISITDAAHIVFHGLRGNDDKRLSFEQVGEAIIQAGIANVSMAVVEFASRSLSGVTMGKREGEEAPL